MKDIFERDMAGEPVSIDENIIAAAEGRRPRRSRGALRAGAIPLQRPAEKKKPPPAASEKPFDRRGKLR